jgi:UDP-N-acetylmuramoyl-tripeptide--D-alanyl-D-alanine ligase
MQLYKVFLENPVICTDSRNCPEGSIFFALRGDKFDANLFALKALQNGCAYAVVDNPDVAVDNRFILVDNVLLALQNLAREHRLRLGTTIIGITGTNGKTTTKELIASVLSQKYNILYTQGNLNNHIGVPLTLLQLKPEHELAIIEMGANHPGEIKTLSEIACPDYGIITNVGKAHLEGFGSFEGVMRTKAELYDYIAAFGEKIFINSSNQFLQNMAEKSGLNHNEKKVTYQLSTSDEMQALSYKISGNTPYLQIQCTNSKGTVFDINTKLTGNYNAENVMAAITIGDYFHLTIDELMKGIESYEPKNNRSQLYRTKHNELIIDAYNANPTSMMASILNFAELNNDNKMLILGDMLELGEYSGTEHQNIIDLLKKLNFKNVMLVGKEFAQTEHNFKSFSDVEKLIEYFNNIPVHNHLILIKGSRGIQLEKVIKVL